MTYADTLHNQQQVPFIVFRDGDKEREEIFDQALEEEDLNTLMALAPWSAHEVINGLVAAWHFQHPNLHALMMSQFDVIASPHTTATNMAMSYLIEKSVEFHQHEVFHALEHRISNQNDIRRLMMVCVEDGNAQAWNIVSPKHEATQQSFWVDVCMECAGRHGHAHMIDLIAQSTPTRAAFSRSLINAVGEGHLEFVQAIWPRTTMTAAELLIMSSEKGFSDLVEFFLPLTQDQEAEAVLKAFWATNNEDIAHLLAGHLTPDLLRKTPPENTSLEPFHHAIVQSILDKQALDQQIDPSVHPNVLRKI